MTGTDLADLRTVADYQFGRGAGRALFPPDTDHEVRRTATGRPEQIHAPAGRVVTYGVDGRFTLGLVGGRRLVAVLQPPAARVVVGDESAPHVRDGRNAFAKFVRRVDPAVRPGDEVAVLHADGDLLAVGRAELPGPAMPAFDRGVAVSVRAGAGD